MLRTNKLKRLNLKFLGVLALALVLSLSVFGCKDDGCGGFNIAQVYGSYGGPYSFEVGGYAGGAAVLTATTLTIEGGVSGYYTLATDFVISDISLVDYFSYDWGFGEIGGVVTINKGGAVIGYIYYEIEAGVYSLFLGTNAQNFLTSYLNAFIVSGGGTAIGTISYTAVNGGANQNI
jgi:hypothetical protein